MVPFELKVLAKFGHCSNCSQKLDECSLARARKIFATARMLGFSFKFPYGKTEEPSYIHALRMFLETCILVLLTFYQWKLTHETCNSSQNMHSRKVESNLET